MPHYDTKTIFSAKLYDEPTVCDSDFESDGNELSVLFWIVGLSGFYRVDMAQVFVDDDGWLCADLDACSRVMVRRR